MAILKIWDGSDWVDIGVGVNIGVGTGNVVGPASSIDSHLAVFDGITGKLIKDGGASGDPSGLDLELMKISFQSVSWAQFAILEDFNDSTDRASPDPSTYDARVYDNSIDNGADTTTGRTFGFTSKTYTGITTVYTGTSTGVGSGYLEDSAATWFSGQYINYVLVDSTATAFDITGCTVSPYRLTFTGTPTAGAYSVRAGLPTTAIAFCSYLDVTNGGTGNVKLEVSFNGGANWQTFLATATSINVLGGAVTITNSGHNFLLRASLINDAGGNGAIIYKVLVATDPSVWG